MDQVREEAHSLENAVKKLIKRRMKRLESVSKEDRGIFIEISIFVREGKAQLLSRPLSVVRLRPKATHAGHMPSSRKK